MYKQYGPTLFTCLSFVRNELLFAASALSGFVKEVGRYIASDKVNFNMDDESHTLILVTRLPMCRDDVKKFAYGRVEPITHMIKLKLRNQLRKETRAARITLYNSFANVKGTRCVAGVVCESLAQEMLEQKIALELVPMVKRELGRFGRRLKIPRWHSDHGDGANGSLVRPIDITPAETFVRISSVWPRNHI
ncbi:hypothetical protein EDB83DRAFT_709217 [Lactarius deliciosus]|nr:hypothetical protein EDB83DRAFT_709217 [Lactarius deliciosus]